MRLASLRSSVFLIAGLVLGIAASPLMQPLWKEMMMRFSYDRYASLVFKCDNAMREHMRAKHLTSNRPSQKSVEVLESAELALLDCQEYDLMRKRLVQWGLSENELGLMGLRAIEERSTTLHKVIRIHEIRY